jgi:hypothetical protein
VAPFPVMPHSLLWGNLLSIEQIPAKSNLKLDSMLNVLSSGNDPQILSLSGLEGFMQTEDTVRVIIGVIFDCVECVIANSYLVEMVESSCRDMTDINLASKNKIINSDTTFINDINKLSPSSEEWGQTYGGSGEDYGFSIYQTSDGGYIIAGESKNGSAGGYDIWLLKTDSNGNEEWSRIFGGIESEKGNSVYQSSDGGYCIAGGTSSFGNRDRDLWLIRTNNEGNIEWEGLYGGNGNDCAESVKQTDDGGLIVSG